MNNLIAMHGIKGKVKCTLVQALRFCTGRTAHWGSIGIALLFLDHGTGTGWGVSITPRPLFTPGKTRYLLYRRLGGPVQEAGWACTGGWVGPRAGLDRCRKSRPPTGFDRRTVQPVASLYTDWATRPTMHGMNKFKTITGQQTEIIYNFRKLYEKEAVILCIT